MEINIYERAELAAIYAEDGALRTAAKILTDLAAEVTALADAKDKALDAIVAKRGA